MNIEDRILALAEKATPGPWVRGWWSGQAESHCVCADKGALLGKRKQNEYRGAGPFHIHEKDFFPDEHRISGPAPECVPIASNYDYEAGGIVEEEDAAYIASCSPEVVAAMCRVIAAARVGCHHRCAEKMFVRHVPECVVGAALAALDEMGRKA